MGTALIIGVGGVGSVTAQKCFQVPEVFDRIILASRTPSKCIDVKKKLGNPNSIITERVDADNVKEVTELIKEHSPQIVINTALPYQDLSIMEACLRTGVHYLDTANYEAPDMLTFSYEHQWKLHGIFKKTGIMALLGSGFDPGVTNVFITYLKKHHFDVMETVDILDCNGGDHGHPFATNFNTEINIREITQKGKFWDDGVWRETPPLSFHRDFDFPGIGTRRAYLMFHEEMESLVKHYPEIKRMSFWMTFSDQYLNHLRVLENVGMTSIEPVNYQGKEIVPLQFLDSILPTPASLGVRTKGKTCIGCLIHGKKDGKDKDIFIYNNCDHEQCYEEVGSQAVSYTTGVPAMIGAKMIMEGKWTGAGTFCLEEFDPDPFMEDLNKYGLPWVIQDGVS